MTTLKDDATQHDDAVDEADLANEAKEVDAVNAVEPETSAEELFPDTESTAEDATAQKRPIAWTRVLAYGVLPGLALVVALATGYLKWLGGSAQDAAALRAETVRIGSGDAVALLSYKPESVEKDLGAARERLTGDFKDAYTTLTRQVVIPGAKEKHISAVAKASAAASVSATDSHAVVLVFVNQTVTVGEGEPTDTAPVVRVVLDKVNDRWLVSHFDPV
jgi:Mce-associated membrane protein